MEWKNTRRLLFAGDRVMVMLAVFNRGPDRRFRFPGWKRWRNEIGADGVEIGPGNEGEKPG